MALILNALVEKLHKVFCKNDSINDVLKKSLETFKDNDITHFHVGILVNLLLACSGPEQKIICLQQLKTIYVVIKSIPNDEPDSYEELLSWCIELLETSELQRKKDLVKKIKTRINMFTKEMFSWKKVDEMTDLEN